MSKKKGKVVTLRTMRDRKQGKKLSDEPEMKELKRMIKDGELDPDRAINHLKNLKRTPKASYRDGQPKTKSLKGLGGKNSHMEGEKS